MIKTLAKLEQVVSHRVDLGMRWFGIEDDETMGEFVFNDADIKAFLQDSDDVVKEIVAIAVADIMRGERIAEHRKSFGDVFVDMVIAVIEGRYDEEETI